MTHGYARCSTSEDRQDINRQTRELKKQGVERVWLEFEHGDTASKEQQRLMLSAAKPGDTILTLEVSRLARSTKQLCEIIDVIRDKHLRLVIVGSITMDCRDGRMDPMTEAFLQIAGVFSQLELSMIRERVRSGVENARAKGKQLGRPQFPYFLYRPCYHFELPGSFFLLLCVVCRIGVYVLVYYHAAACCPAALWLRFLWLSVYFNVFR